MNALRTMLLVDDSENDLILLETALEQARFNCNIQKALNGEEAIAYLRGEDRFKDRVRFPVPAAVLLDLNMPNKNGFEVLSWVREARAFQSISFIVLTASLRMEDVKKAAELGAASYLVKPASLRELISMLSALKEWLRINHCPPGNKWVGVP
jgi:CheY-like chemotaxis protein